jgi:hypothetical protein
MQERELEQAFREGLATLGEEAGTTAPTVRQVVDRARDGAGRRHRRSGWAVGVAAAAVVAVVAGVVVVRGGGQGGPEPSPATSSRAIEAPEVPAGYRLELWHGVGLYVPALWAWGASPISTARGDVVQCDSGEVVLADGSRRNDPSQPYVGRPFMLSKACDPTWATVRPKAPYVWLDPAKVGPGTVDLGAGWVRETVEVDDVTVSVATDDPALRRAILGSVHRVSGECDPTLWNPPTADGSTDPDFVPTSMVVCAYGQSSTKLDYALLYEQELTMGPAKALVAAVDSAPDLGSKSCFGASGGDWALLRLRGQGGEFRDYAVDMNCPSITDPSGTQHQLTGEVVRSWAVGGVNAVLHRHPAVRVPDRFIPPLS